MEKLNITSIELIRLTEVYRNQTKKYFNPELVDKDCGICKAVPSYIAFDKKEVEVVYNDDDIDEEEAYGSGACNDCPLGIADANGGNFVTCVQHETYVLQWARLKEGKDTMEARGDYLIERGELFGIDMSGIKK